MESIKTAINVNGFIESRIGGRTENQDSCGYADTPLGLLVVVCDGMGGTTGGKTASMIAVNEIIQGVNEADPTEEPAMILKKALRKANMSIIKQTYADPQLLGMGTTATVLLLNEHSALLAHVGDSRIYHFRGRSKIYRTFDHSMVFELVKQKVITEEQARLSEQSNMITRALGIKTEVDADVCERAYEKGDRFLLCTDGISGSLPEAELVKLATTQKSSVGATLDLLTTTVDSYGHDNGGLHDNLTAALIETNSNSQIKEKMSKRIKKILAILLFIIVMSLMGNVILIRNSRLDKVEPSAVKDSCKTVHSPAILNSESDTLIVHLKLVKNNLTELKKEHESFEKQLNQANNNEQTSKVKESFKKLKSKLDLIINQLDKQLTSFGKRNN